MNNLRGMMWGVRPDIILCLIILVAIFVYALRHPDVDGWRWLVPF